MITLNLAICTITPPIAVNPVRGRQHLGRVDGSMEDVSRWVLPFFLALMVTLVIVILFPPLSLWLPNALGIR